MADVNPDPTPGDPPADPPSGDPPAEPDDATAGLKKALHAERTRAGQPEKRLKAIEDAGKSETERERDARTTAERERDAARSELMRFRVATKHQIPAELASRLMGDTEEALEEDAQRLLEVLRPAGNLGGRTGGFSTPSLTPTEQMNEQIRVAMRGGHR